MTSLIKKCFESYKAPLLFALLNFFYGLHFVYNIRLGTPPDEIPHLSYINDSINSKYFIPDYESGRMIDSDDLNYLAHPPLYYSLAAAVSLFLDLEPYKNYHIFRIFSLAMVSLGVFFISATAVNLKFKELQLFLVMALAVCIPNFYYIAASINNDNLSFLGTSILFYSLSIFYTENQNSYKYGSIGVVVSFFILALTKANVALFSGIFLISWMLFSKFNFLRFFLSRGVVLLIFSSLMLLFGYYLFVWNSFGKLFPSPKYVYEINPVESPMAFVEYLYQFLMLFVSRFSMAFGHQSYEVYNGIMLKIFYFSTLLPLFVYPFFRIASKFLRYKLHVFSLFDSLYFSAIVLLGFHLVLGYQGYLQTGLIAAVQPRYYLFLFPMIWIPTFYVLALYKYQRFLFISFSIPVLILFSVYLSSAPREQTIANFKTPESAKVTLTKLSSGQFYHLDLPLLTYQVGSIDYIGHKNSYFAVQGWSFDNQKSKSPIYIHVFVNKKPLLRGKVSFARPDVAYALKNLSANFSGFNLKLINPDNRFEICSVDVLAEFDDGNYSVLRHSTCD
jgi:hypothetical protein